MKIFIKISFLVLTGMFFISVGWGLETKDVYKALIDHSGIQKVDMLGGSYFFKPNDVIVKVNVPVEITIKKESGFVPHNIVMHSPEAGMDFKVDIGTDPKTITFTPTKTGKYPFYCDKGFLFWNHREKGMEGVLEVTE